MDSHFNSTSGSFLRKFKDTMPAVFAVALFYIALYLITGEGCPIKCMTGISCPGCGMTRATFSALTLHFDRAFYYHPIWILPSAWVVLYLCRDRIPKTLYKAFAWVTILLFGIVYVLRMIDGSEPIVVFEPQNGIYFRLVRSVILFLIGE